MKVINLDIISVLSLSVAGAFLLTTLSSILTEEPDSTAGRKLVVVSPFKVWNRSEKPFPCVTDGETNGGIYYVRIPRTSSKGVSVSQRIGGLEGRLLDLPEDKGCKVNAVITPMRAFHQDFSNRDRANSFLWSMVREPGKRAISHFGLRLRNGDVEATAESFINDIRTSASYRGNIELRFLSMEDVSADESEEKNTALVNDVLSEYNFIGVEERMRESLVALSMIIGTNVNHVIYEFSRCASNDAPEWLTPEMALYLESSEWKERQGGDIMLYNAVNKALDLTIQQLDSEEFKERLEKFDAILTKWSQASTIVKGTPGCGAAFDKKHPADLIEWVNDLPGWQRKQVLGM